MPISFPTSLDSFTNPNGTDKLNSPDHAGQHSNKNDAIEALEAKVGIDGSAVATSHDYMLDNAAGRFKAHDHSGDDSENSDLLPLTLRLPNNVYYRGRNNAGGADVNLIKTDTSDAIIIGTNNSNDHTVINAGTSKLVKIKVLRQDIASDSYEENTVFLTGWDFNIGSGASDAIQEATTFGITFSQAPIVLISALGYKVGSDPTGIDDITARHGEGITATDTITTTGFNANYYDAVGSNLSTNSRFSWAWIAVGELN